MIEPTTSYTHYNAVSDGNQINVIDNRSDRIKDFGSDFTGIYIYEQGAQTTNCRPTSWIYEAEGVCCCFVCGG